MNLVSAEYLGSRIRYSPVEMFFLFMVERGDVLDYGVQLSGLLHGEAGLQLCQEYQLSIH